MCPQEHAHDCCGRSPAPAQHVITKPIFTMAIMTTTTMVPANRGRRQRSASQAWMILREAIRVGSHKKAKAKRVRFSWSAPEEHTTPSSYFEPTTGGLPNKEELWYQLTDYLEFRKQAAIDARDIKVNMRALVDCIIDAYGTACRTASKTNNEFVLAKALQNIEADVRLTFWGHGGHNRGIEKCFRNTMARRNGIHARLSYTAVAITSQLKCDSDELRQTCESHSRQDRIFARMMGEADACIATRSDDVCLPTKLAQMNLDEVKDDFNDLRDDAIYQCQLFPRQA